MDKIASNWPSTDYLVPPRWRWTSAILMERWFRRSVERLRIETQPPPVTMLARDRATKLTVRINAADFDPALYASIESRVLALAGAYEREQGE